MAVVPFPPPLPTQIASLYVGDLDPSVTEFELLEAFSRVSNVCSARLCRDFVSGKSLRYAYLNFLSPANASEALRCLNYTCLNGKPMRIMWSERNPYPRKIGTANVFVKNLDPSINSLGLYDMFCKFGNVLSCKVAEENGTSKGFGFVRFDTERSAMSAIGGLHGAFVQGKKLFASKFTRKSLRECEKPQFEYIFANNLNPNVTEEMLREWFSRFGRVCKVGIIKDDMGIRTGIGFVSFESVEDAKNALESSMNNGAPLGTLQKGKPLCLTLAQRNMDNSLAGFWHQDELGLLYYNC